MFDLNTLKKIYYSSPKFVKNLIGIIPYRYRVPSIYKRWQSRLTKLPIDPERYIDEKLEETLRIAKKIQGYDLSNADISLNDMSLLEKEDIQNDLNLFINDEVDKKFYVTTGGSTGKQAKFFQSNNVWWKEQAFFHDFFNRLGYKPSAFKASFRGGDFRNINTGENIFWKENPIYNEIHFSPFHINPQNITSYVKKLNKEKPLYFHAYPSSVLNLLRCMREKSCTLDYQLNGILLISEQFDHQTESEIKEFFDCDVISFYGLSERVVFARSLDDCSSYQVDSRYGYFELLDENDKVIEENNVRGEIVGTSFDNYAMPLVRYKTGDFTSYIDYENKIIRRIEGKWDQTYLEGKNNERIYLSALNFHDKVFDKTHSFQYRQCKKGKIDLLIVAKDNLNEKDANLIRERHNERVGEVADFDVKIIDNPMLSDSGKFLKVLK